MEVSKQEIGTFLTLFNRDGYVLDFSTNEFDNFTAASIGTPLCRRYGLSKGKSLTAFLDTASQTDAIKLLTDLFQRYEENFVLEYDENACEDDHYGHYHKFNRKYENLYKTCKVIVNRWHGASQHIEQAAERLKQEFSSEYLSKQIDEMLKLQEENPTLVIGMAKELVESCCKTILDNLNVEWSDKWDLPQLTNATMDELHLLPKYVDENERGADAVKAILGNLLGIVTKIGELRNPFGSGHGKSASFRSLEKRHAELAVGSSITFAQFVWETYLAEHLKKDK